MTTRETLQFVADSLDIHLFTLAGTEITLATVVVFVLILMITWFASVVVRRALVRWFRLRKVTDEGTIGVTNRLTYYVVLLTGFGVALQTVGINLSALFAAGAVFAIGIGFALQNMAQSFVSGVILLVEGSIKPGHVLLMDDGPVRVQRMGIRATMVRTLDDEEMILPNSALVQSNVVNLTLGDSLLRLRCPVGVVYTADMERVREVLEQAAEACTWRVKDHDPVILLDEFGSSSVNWEVSVWIDKPLEARLARSRLNEAIWFALKEARITIAFPQLDVHLDPPVMESLAGLRHAS